MQGQRSPSRLRIRQSMCRLLHCMCSRCPGSPALAAQQAPGRPAHLPAGSDVRLALSALCHAGLCPASIRPTAATRRCCRSGAAGLCTVCMLLARVSDEGHVHACTPRRLHPPSLQLNNSFFSSWNASLGQEEIDEVIQRDLHRTFPEHPLFAFEQVRQVAGHVGRPAWPAG